MKQKNILYTQFVMVLIFSIGLVSCVEEFNFENDSFEYVLVIDATITNEEKKHTIYINRTHRFEEEGPNRVTGATVHVLADDEIIVFEEIVSGQYTSIQTFAAQPGTNYTLQVTTQDGSAYTSSPVALTTKTNIDNLYAKRETNDDGVSGIAIYVDSYDPTNSSKYYSYEFEETFKVVAPAWRDQDAYLVLEEECVVGLTPRSIDKRTCYRSEDSNFINVTSTTALIEDRLEAHLVHFLSNQNYKISHRYSILVSQFVLNEQSFQYWENLNNLVDKESLFSQTQGGYVPGNITSVSNPVELVVGYFDVSSVTKKRLYFNYTDFYPTEPLPPYALPCTLSSPARIIMRECGPLIDVIKNNSSVYLEDNIGGGGFYQPGPYIMVPRPCGDCTALGDTEPPEFWID